MSRVYPNIPYELEAEDYLSEKLEAEGNITMVMLTSGERFAAKKDRLLSRKEC